MAPEERVSMDGKVSLFFLFFDDGAADFTGSFQATAQRAEFARVHFGGVPWKQSEWVGVPEDDELFVRTLEDGQAMRILHLPVTTDEAMHLAGLEDEAEKQAAWQAWLRTATRVWNSFCADHPDTARWVPPDDWKSFEEWRMDR